jgi:hypothetical protein
MDQIEVELAAVYVSVGDRVEPVWVSKSIREFMTSEKVEVPALESSTKLDDLMDLADALRSGLNHVNSGAYGGRHQCQAERRRHNNETQGGRKPYPV